MKTENEKPSEDNNHQKSLVEQLEFLNSRVDILSANVIVLSQEVTGAITPNKKTHKDLSESKDAMSLESLSKEIEEIKAIDELRKLQIRQVDERIDRELSKLR